MELRVLRHFLMAAREESITRAAEKRHVTLPTLSRQLMQLEEELGTPLFHRNNHRIVLTEDGMLLKRRAQELLEPVETPHYDSARMPQKERWGALVRADSTLAGVESLSPKKLLRWPLLLPTRESVHSQLMDWFVESYPNVQVAARFDFTFNAAIMAKHQMGWPSATTKAQPFSPACGWCSLSPTLENGAVLAWKKNLPRSRAVEQFIAHIKNTAV